MNNKLTIIFSALLLIFCSCHRDKDVVKIGVVAPLTGAASAASEYCLDGFNMAIQELNAKDNGLQYKIIFEDCQSDPTLASNCYKRLELQGVKYVVGLGGQFALAIAPMTKGKEMIYFTTADYNESILNMTDCGFRVFPSATTVAEVSAKFLADSLKVKKVATITMNTVACLMATEKFMNSMKSQNVEVVYQDTYDIGTSDFKNTITKMLNTGVEAVFFNGFGISPAAFCSQLSQHPQFDNLVVIGDVNFSTKSFQENNKNKKIQIYYADSEMGGTAAQSYFAEHKIRPNSYVQCCYMLPHLVDKAITSSTDKGNFASQRDALRGHVVETPAGDISFDDLGNADMGMKIFKLN